MGKLKNSKAITVLIIAIIAVLMLFSNAFTQEFADDYNYHFSWFDGERIDSVLDIFPSMGVHYTKVNGRLVAHFFVQLFEMLPKALFNIVNTALFLAMLVLMQYICVGKQRHNIALLALFGAVWVFTPAFGQVFLWLDGSCNYLWGVVIGLLFALPFIRAFLFDKPVQSLPLNILLVVFGLFAGAYSENGSAGFIAIVILIQLAQLILQHKRLSIWGVAATVSSLIGFGLMILAPGTAKNKGGDLALTVLKENFITALEQYRKLEILLIVLCVSWVIAYMTHIRKERLVLSVIFFIGSLCSNFIMTAAAYYADRSLLFSTVMLIVSIGLLWHHIGEIKPYTVLTASCCSVLLLYTAFFVCLGVEDVYTTGRKFRQNELYIEQCCEEGVQDIRIPLIESDTKYCAFNGLGYLTHDPNEWQNKSIAQYYEVNSIVGYWPTNS